MQYIYKITNIKNNMSYIGQTNNIKRRWARHKKSQETKSMLISRIIKQDGVNNFTFEVIDTCLTVSEANVLEYRYIKEYNSIIPNGYNVSAGGNSSTLNQSSRDKIGESNSGDNCKTKKISSIDAIDIYEFFRLDNFTINELAYMYRIHRKLISIILHRKRWKRVTAHLPDINNFIEFPGAKIDAKLAVSIYLDGLNPKNSYKKLAIKYKTTVGIVNSIMSKQRWKSFTSHLPDKDDRRKFFVWPSMDKLIEMVKETSQLEVATKLGVSAPAVHRKLKIFRSKNL